MTWRATSGRLWPKAIAERKPPHMTAGELVKLVVGPPTYCPPRGPPRYGPRFLRYVAFCDVASIIWPALAGGLEDDAREGAPEPAQVCSGRVSYICLPRHRM